MGHIWQKLKQNDLDLISISSEALQLLTALTLSNYKTIHQASIKFSLMCQMQRAKPKSVIFHLRRPEQIS